MPGKVNPVMSEVVLQVAAQVAGNDAAISFGAALGSSFELNVAMPLIAHNLLQSIGLLTNATRIFTRRCVSGLEADEERCAANVERSLALATSLVPAIGFETGRTIREVALEKSGLSPERVEELLNQDRVGATVPPKLSPE
jgi:fumarate hydratase class II